MYTLKAVLSRVQVVLQAAALPSKGLAAYCQAAVMPPVYRPAEALQAKPCSAAVRPVVELPGRLRHAVGFDCAGGMGAAGREQWAAPCFYLSGESYVTNQRSQGSSWCRE